MHAETESRFGRSWEETRHVLQDLHTATGEILQHKCRPNLDDINPISHLQYFTADYAALQAIGLLDYFDHRWVVTRKGPALHGKYSPKLHWSRSPLMRIPASATIDHRCTA